MPDTQAKIYRLTDILTKEVSVVDRGANQRVWLLVKRDDQSGHELREDGKGGFKTEKTEASQATSPGNADPKASCPGSEPGSEPGAAEPPPAAEPPAPAKMAKATYAGIVKAIEELTALAQSVSPDELSEIDPPGVELALASAVSKLGTVVQAPAEQTAPGWVDGVCKVATKDLKKALKTASEKLNEVAESLAVDTTDTPPPEELRWRISDVLYALVQLSQFETAQAALTKSDDEAKAYRTLVAGIGKAFEVSEKSEPVPQQKSFDAEGAVKLVSIAERVLKAYRSQVQALKKRVQQLEEEPLQSNRLSVELNKQRESGRVTWPADMNAKYLSDTEYDFDRASANG